MFVGWFCGISYTQTPLRLHNDSFKYLGVHVTERFKDLFKNNFKVELERTKQDLTRWSSLPLSLAGRINSIKMAIMPRFLFLFQMIPTFIPKAFFTEINKYISTFIWNRTVPRIRRTFLESPRENGGSALPNLMHYYWVANLHALSYWTSDIPEHEALVWLLMEQHSNSPSSLVALACAPMPISKHYHTNNPITGSSLRIWSQFRVHLVHKKPLLSSPIFAYPFFPPSLIDPAFKLWKSRGLICVKDFFKDGLFISFDYLQVRFDIPNTHFFRYL